MFFVNIRYTFGYPDDMVPFLRTPSGYVRYNNNKNGTALKLYCLPDTLHKLVTHMCSLFHYGGMLLLGYVVTHNMVHQERYLSLSI